MWRKTSVISIASYLSNPSNIFYNAELSLCKMLISFGVRHRPLLLYCCRASADICKMLSLS